MSLNFIKACSFNQNKLWTNWKILDHVSDAYIACVSLFGHLFWNKRSFWQPCQIISCHIRKLSAHDRWPTPNGNPVIVSGLLNGNESEQDFYHLFIYELPLEIQLSRGEGWDPIYRFNPATFPTSYAVVFFVFSESS
jgi:hypothetical protein